MASKIYNLSVCITTETEINPTSSTNYISTNSIPRTDQSQATTTIIIYSTIKGTVTAERTEDQNVSYTTTKPLSNREAQLEAVIGALAGLVVVLLVMAIIPWIWICWRSKVNQEPKGDKQQIRCIYIYYRNITLYML